MTANRFALYRYPQVVSRPLTVESAVMATYLLRRLNEKSPSALLGRFLTRLRDCAKVRQD